MPDVFVPVDTAQYTRFHRQLAAKGIVVNANLRYVDAHRSELKRQYPTFESFNTGVVGPQKLMDEILAEGKKQQTEPKDEAELAQTLGLLRTQVKALVARDLWGMSEYFNIMNEENHLVARALQLLAQP